MTLPSTVYLQPPYIANEYIQEKIICVRAHRERIFMIDAHLHNEKLICHNYGQGGAGWTFLFGCIEKSLQQFEHMLIRHPEYAQKPICVIGAGCYGLLTAVSLARKGYQVRIVAQEYTHISSYKAAGFFFPRPRKTSTHQEQELFYQCGITSLQTYLSIMQGAHPFIATGAHLLPAYYSPDIDPGFGPYIEQGLLPPAIPITVDFGNGKNYSLMKYYAPWIDSTQLMHELMQEALRLGISMEHKTVSDFKELEEPIIFNCAGLGARTLAHDTRLIPVQGHLILLKNQPSLEQIHYMINVRVTMKNPNGSLRDELIYYAPKSSGIIGITFIRGQDSLTANHHEFDRIVQRCQDFFGTPIPS